MGLLLVAMVVIGLALPNSTEAIVFLPALILIPIAKIVAIVIGALALPTTSVGILWAKLFKHSTKRAVAVIAGILLIAGIIAVVVAKLHNPDRPWF